MIMYQKLRYITVFPRLFAFNIILCGQECIERVQPTLNHPIKPCTLQSKFARDLTLNFNIGTRGVGNRGAGGATAPPTFAEN